MRKSIRSLALGSALLFGFSLVFASPAFADCEGTLAPFNGLIQKMKKGKKGRFVVDNRMGDKLKFSRADTSKVEDQRGTDRPKTEWDALKNGDYVMVCWNRMEKGTRKAYQVIVLPPPTDSGEDQ